MLSSIRGFNIRSECRKAQAAHLEWVRAGSPNDPAAVEHEREANRRAACDAWRAELAAATNDSDKLAVAQRRPASCD